MAQTYRVADIPYQSWPTIAGARAAADRLAVNLGYRPRIEVRLPDGTWADPDTEIPHIATQEFLVESNVGTFGAEECCRVTGTGESRHGEYRIYERVGDGRRRVEGRDPSDAPGYPRRMSRDLTAARRVLRALRAAIR